MILLFLAIFHQGYRHLVEHNGNVPAFLLHVMPPPPLPPPSLSLSVSLVDSDSQAFLSAKQRDEFPIVSLLSFWNESSLPSFSSVCK